MRAQPFPLTWPVQVPRTPADRRQRGAFGRTVKKGQQLDGSPRGTQKAELTVHMAADRVEQEVRRITEADVDSLVISTNVGGVSRKQPEDPGAAVYFNRNGRPLCFPCDRYTTVQANLAAIAAHLEAMRGMERWGVGTTEQLFIGFQALPAPGSDWRTVLEFGPETFHASTHVTPEQVEVRFRELAKKRHPDRGGSHEDFVRLEEARRVALEELGG